jgi:hypothetical protein
MPEPESTPRLPEDADELLKMSRAALYDRLARYPELQ